MNDLLKPAVALLLTTALMSVGCSSTNGPADDMRVNGVGARVQGDVAVAVNVIDKRSNARQARSDGSIVVASGKKGTVTIPQQPTVLLQQRMTAALQQAGFRVDPNAPLVVDAELVQLHVDAREFTDFDVSSETGSTLDAARLVLPGPVDPVRARSVINVNLRKHDRVVSLNAISEKEAAAKDTDQSIVEKVVSVAITRAVNDVVEQIAPRVAVIAKVPVTDAEFRQVQTELERTRAQLASTEAQLRQRERQLQDGIAASKTIQQDDAETRRLAKQVQDQSKTIDSLNQQLAQLRNAADANTAAKQQQIASLQQQLEKQQREAIQASQRLVELRQRHEAEEQRLLAALKAAEASSTNTSAQAAAQRQRIEKLESQLEAARAARQNAETELAAARENADAKLAAARKFADTVAATEQEFTKLNETVQVLQSELSKTNTQLAKRTHDLEEARITIKALQDWQATLTGGGQPNADLAKRLATRLENK